MKISSVAHAENEYSILLVRSRDREGRQHYRYIRMSNDKIRACKKAIKQSGRINFSEFGDVLASGEGEPDAATRNAIKKKYGFRHA